MSGLFAFCLGCAGTSAEQLPQTPTDTQPAQNSAPTHSETAPDDVAETPENAQLPKGGDTNATQDTAGNGENAQLPMMEDTSAAQDTAENSENAQLPKGDDTSATQDIAGSSENALLPKGEDTSAAQDTAGNSENALLPQNGGGSPNAQSDQGTQAPSEPALQPAKTDPEKVKALHTEADWFVPDSSRKWYKQTSRHANRKFLKEYFTLIGYEAPKHTYALIAPLETRNGKLSMQYYSYMSTAFEFSMTPAGEEKYWPASTVKLAAAVLALLKLREYGAGGNANVSFTDLEGQYDGPVEKLCREAIIPSNNTAYNRLMEIAGFDEINDHYLRDVFHFPKMVLQRRYVRHHPEDSLRDSPEIKVTDGSVNATIPERHSSGKMRPECPRESNCTTLAELGEVMFRVVLHEELAKNRKLPLPLSDIELLRDALKRAPSCIGDGVAAAMGSGTVIFNKGGKVIGDDRLEVAVVSSPDKKERYLVALSMPYYEGVEKETNRLAMHLITAMQQR